MQRFKQRSPLHRVGLFLNFFLSAVGASGGSHRRVPFHAFNGTAFNATVFNQPVFSDTLFKEPCSMQPWRELAP